MGYACVSVVDVIQETKISNTFRVRLDTAEK